MMGRVTFKSKEYHLQLIVASVCNVWEVNKCVDMGAGWNGYYEWEDDGKVLIGCRSNHIWVEKMMIIITISLLYEGMAKEGGNLCCVALRSMMIRWSKIQTNKIIRDMDFTWRRNEQQGRERERDRCFVTLKVRLFRWFQAELLWFVSHEMRICLCKKGGGWRMTRRWHSDLVRF